jgi:hypothetical protein
MIVNKELETMWKYAAMTYIKAVSQNLPEGTGKNHKKEPQSSYEVVGVLTDIQTRHLRHTTQRCSAVYVVVVMTSQYMLLSHHQNAGQC